MNAHQPPPLVDASNALAAQRVAGRGELRADCMTGGRTVVRGLLQEGAAKLRFPFAEDGFLQTVLINTAGGLTGGDRLAWNIEASAGTRVTVTTQACEKVYRALSGQAEVSVRLSAGAGASIAWLPQETIVFDRAVFARSLDVDLATDARALLVEATVFGRTAMGESVRRCDFRDRWRVRCAEALVHAEDFAIGGHDVAGALARHVVADGGIAMATLLLIAPDAERLLDAAREILGDSGGASFWQVAGTGKLLARLVARDGYALRKRLVPLIELLNGQAALPKLWSL